MATSRPSRRWTAPTARCSPRSSTRTATRYWSLLIVNKDSDLKTLDDVLKRGASLSYGAGDPNSTSGTAVPGYYLWAANKIEPKTFFKTVRASNHEANLLSVINKQVDVAVNNTESLERYRISTGKDANERVRVLWKSPLIPADPLVMRKDLPADLKVRIRDFFVNYGKGQGRRARTGQPEGADLQGLPRVRRSAAGADPPDRAGARQGQGRGRHHAGPGRKQKQLAELDRKLADLGQPTAKQ